MLLGITLEGERGRERGDHSRIVRGWTYTTPLSLSKKISTIYIYSGINTSLALMMSIDGVFRFISFRSTETKTVILLLNDFTQTIPRTHVLIHGSPYAQRTRRRVRKNSILHTYDTLSKETGRTNGVCDNRTRFLESSRCISPRCTSALLGEFSENDGDRAPR